MLVAPGAAEEIGKEAAEALGRQPSEYDSHPPPEQRIRWVHALAVPAPTDDPGGLAWELFDDREAVERDMTEQIRRNVRENTGNAIPEEAQPQSPPPTC